MKRIAILVAAAAAFILASCASTGGASSSAPASEPAPAPASTPAASAAPAKVEEGIPEGAVAFWNFKKKPGGGRISESYAVFESDVPLPAIPGSTGATLKLLAGSEAKYLEEPEWFLTTNNKSSTTLDDIASTYKAVLELKVDADSTVSLTVSGNGDASVSRIVAVMDGTGNLLASKNNMGKDPFETITAKVSAGTYNIYMNGARLHAVTVSK